jgi:SAM-dependent methyltransferase
MTGWQTAGPLSPAAQLQMGLWGSDPDGWARFAEPHNQPLFAAVLDATGAGPGTRLLDLGCGTGLLLALAQARGATVTGLDVTPGLLKIARDRLPTAELWQADIASLPFGAAEFDVVTGVNTFQFAADPPAALAGAARVVRPGGLVAIGTFAAPERAESTAVHLAMAALSPPRRQADHAPYALTRDNLAAALAAAGLEQEAEGEVECVWRYASLADAVRGLIGSAGGTRAVQDAGRAPVRAAIEGALAPFTDPSTGGISMRNAMRWVTARRPARGVSGPHQPPG